MTTIIEHSLVQHWLGELRDQATGPAEFRRLVRTLGAAVFYEASRNLALRDRLIRTPLAEAQAKSLVRSPILAPVLRAGLGMAEGIIELVPEAQTCHIGMYRDHHTLQAVLYYPPGHHPTDGLADGRDVFVMDPMLATGGSALAAIEVVRRWGAASISLLGIVGAPEGVSRVEAAFPEVPIYLCALDDRLNDIGYIVPGLGDAGDRQYSGG